MAMVYEIYQYKISCTEFIPVQQNLLNMRQCVKCTSYFFNQTLLILFILLLILCGYYLRVLGSLETSTTAG